MSKTPRIPAVNPEQTPDFVSMMSHVPDILSNFATLYAEFWQGGCASAVDKELARLRNARVTDCGY